MIAGSLLSQIPLATPPFALPQGVEFRRTRNPAGHVVLVFSRPDVIAAGIEDGLVGVMEQGFDPGQLPLVLAMLEVASAADGSATIEATLTADIQASEPPAGPGPLAEPSGPSFVSFDDTSGGADDTSGGVTETPSQAVVDPGPGPGPSPSPPTDAQASGA